MDKVLKVIKPFAQMQVGEVLEYDSEKNEYTNTQSQSYSKLDEDDTYTVKCTSLLTLNTDYINKLIESGYLEPVKEDKGNEHVNIFDKIDEYLKIYVNEIKNLKEDMKEAPACLTLEKQTVLENLIRLLDDLKSYKY